MPRDANFWPNRSQTHNLLRSWQPTSGQPPNNHLGWNSVANEFQHKQEFSFAYFVSASRFKHKNASFEGGEELGEKFRRMQKNCWARTCLGLSSKARASCCSNTIRTLPGLSQAAFWSLLRANEWVILVTCLRLAAQSNAWRLNRERIVTARAQFLLHLKARSSK